LLERAGARIRGGGRADCPRCKRQRAVSFHEGRGVYHCHGEACDFSGGAAKLARELELGLARRLSPAEYRELRQNRERADRAARALYGRIKARRFELLDRLHMLNDLEARAHRLGPDNPDTWDALGRVYAERPGILAELAILETANAADLLRFLSAGLEERKRAIDGVIARGGLCDAAGRFMDVPTR
jgi:hypothetical protein